MNIGTSIVSEYCVDGLDQHESQDHKAKCIKTAKGRNKTLFINTDNMIVYTEKLKNQQTEFFRIKKVSFLNTKSICQNELKAIYRV